MKKILLFALTAVMLLSACAFGALAAENETAGTMGVGSAEGKAGDVVSVPVYVKCEPKVSSFVVKVSYDDKALTYIPYAKASDAGDIKLGLCQAAPAENEASTIGIVALASMSSDVECNGTLLNLRFKINEDAVAGKKELKVTYAEAASMGTADENTKTYAFQLENGYVDVAVTDEPIDEEEIESGSAPSGNGGTDVKPITPIIPDNKQEEEKEETPAPVSPEFTDLAGYEWAESYINELAGKGVIKGITDTTFAPGENITRADFIVLLMRVMGITGKGTDNFDDVPADAYYADAVGSAKAMGIAMGSDGKFDPQSPITRQDMAVLVCRALSEGDYLTLTTKEAILGQFKDAEEISDYAVDAMKALVANEIMAGSDGYLQPLASATRAETAVIISRIQKLI